MNFKTDLHICPYAATVSYRKDKSLKDFLVRATVTIPAQIWNSLEYNGASPQSITRLQDKQKKDHWLSGHLKPETFIFCVKWKTESHAWVTTKESFEVCGQLPTIILAPRI